MIKNMSSLLKLQQPAEQDNARTQKADNDHHQENGILSCLICDNGNPTHNDRHNAGDDCQELFHGAAGV